MSEEVQRLHALDLDADQLASLAASPNTVDEERLTLFIAVAKASLCDLPESTVLDGHGWPSLNSISAQMPRLKAAHSSLNGYVHPNYGSHVAALFPERSAAAQVLLEAALAVYEAFFQLSWTEHPFDEPTWPDLPVLTEDWPQIIDRFLSTTLPEIQKSATGTPALREVAMAQATADWLSGERIRSIRGGGDVTEHGAAQDFWMEAGALSSARRAEQLLTEEFPSGAPGPADQVRWLRFNALSLQLAMLLDELKAMAFRAELVRQMNHRNVLGVFLCVRSLIEHRALVISTPKKVGNALSAVASDVQARQALPSSADEVAKPLANFLMVNAKASSEEQRSWIMKEDGGKRKVWLNLDNIVNEAFPDGDRFRTLYDLASGALHGRCERGVSLAADLHGASGSAQTLGLLVLERLCDRDEQMDHLAPAFRHYVQLDHAARMGGSSSVATDHMAQQVFGRLDGELRQGTDYWGDGSAADPFRIAPHLQFHQASYALLRQLGVTDCPRMIDKSEAGRLCDRWRTADRDYWFEINIPE